MKWVQMAGTAAKSGADGRGSGVERGRRLGLMARGSGVEWVLMAGKWRRGVGRCAKVS